jgi:hypothetical protein
MWHRISIRQILYKSNKILTHGGNFNVKIFFNINYFDIIQPKKYGDQEYKRIF